MSQARRKCRDCGALGPWKVYMIGDLENPNWEPPKRGKHWQCPKCDELPKLESDGRVPVVAGNMEKAAEKTVVVFRKWPANEQISYYRLRRDRLSGGIIALFPGIAERDLGMCSSFEHVGQHGMADYRGVIQKTAPACPEEYAGLKRELESAPYYYNLDVRTRRGKT